MNYKYFIKKISSPQTLNILRKINKMSAIPNYYLPYVFMRGRTISIKQLALEITYRCNLNCRMCPQALDIKSNESKMMQKKMKSKEMSFETIKSIVDQSKKLGVNRITITGGEPFVRTDVMDIVEYIKRKKIHCTILSNGSLIKEDHAHRMIQSKLDKLVISLDGPKDIHNLIRGKEVYDRIMNTVGEIQNIKREKGTNVPDLSFSCTISALNYQYLSDIMDIGQKQGVNINYGYLFYTTKEMTEQTNEIIKTDSSKGENQNVPDSIKKVDDEVLWKQITDIKEKEKIYSVKATFTPPLNRKEINDRFNNDCASYTDKCFYPWNNTRVNPYGEVYPCSMDIMMGNIENNTLAEIWNGNKYVDFRKALQKRKLFPKCSKCCALNDKIWTKLPQIYLR